MKETGESHREIIKRSLRGRCMGYFAKQLSAQEVKQGDALRNRMEHLDREMDLLNQQRIRVGASSEAVSYTHLTLPTNREV